MRKPFALLTCIFVPMFAAALHFTWIPEHYLVFVMAAGLVAASLMAGSRRAFQGAQWPLTRFNLSIVIVALFQILILGTASPGDAVYYLQGFVLSLGIVFYMLTWSEDETMQSLRPIASFIGVVFSIQFLLSVYESVHGSYLFGNIEWVNEVYSGMISSEQAFESRVILGVLTSSLGFLSFLKLPFSGLVGQWNYWGTQLPFYNLLFLGAYFTLRKRIFLMLAITVFVASILNTSRFGIASIMATDALLMVWAMRSRKKMLVFMAVIGIAGVFTAARAFSENVGTYLERADTLSLRLMDYGIYWSNLTGFDLSQWLFGLGITDGKLVTLRMSGVTQSFESEFFSKMYIMGGICLLFLFWFLGGLYKTARRERGLGRMMTALLLLNIFSVSVISNLVFVYHIYGIVTVLLMLGPSFNRYPQETPSAQMPVGEQSVRDDDARLNSGLYGISPPDRSDT